MSDIHQSARLPRHAALLRALVDRAQRDPGVRFVELGCSVARGSGDEFSDLDLGIGLEEDNWDAAVRRIATWLTELAPTVDHLEHQLAEWGDHKHCRVFVQYENGLQVDLVIMPAAGRPGLMGGNVALYDADGRLTRIVTPASERAAAGQVREWSFLGWVALADLAKYLKRGSLWEALGRLTLARDHAWRIWAVAIDAPYPAFGLTSVLDHSDPRLPDRMEETVGNLDAADISRAAQAAADVLADVSATTCRLVGEQAPERLAAHVRKQLAQAQP